jgi:putative ABC transport system permease protein
MVERLGVSASRLRYKDLVVQALLSAFYKPGRTFATALGTIIGVAAVVTTIGVSATASQQVSSQFDALRATEVTVQSVGSELAVKDLPSGNALFTPERVASIAALRGVVHVGRLQSFQSVAVGSQPALQAADPAFKTALPVVAADPDTLAALHVRTSDGRLYDRFHESHSQPICLIGSSAAGRLGISRVDNQPALWVGGRALTVIGIVDDVERLQSAKLGLIVPYSTANAMLSDEQRAPTQVTIETAPGAAQVVANQVPYVVSPEKPQLVKSLAPPDPKDLRQSIEGAVHSMLWLVAAISLFIGIIGIANTTLVAVMERVPEIGLRRSLGATRRHIAQQFLLETAVVGTGGGVIGCSAGVIVVVAIASIKGWSPTLDPLVVVLSPFLGTATGLLAGLQPAWRATRIEPTDALRR